MRIEAYNQVQQLYKAPKTGRSASTGAVSSAKDQLQISSIGKDIQSVKAALAGSPDIREDVTAPIKARIQNGTYSVDSGSFAEKLLEKYSAVI